ncbi:MAG TPA: DUF6158 family protein [Jatrophihabitans sp.]|jgi:hypothetical protein
MAVTRGIDPHALSDEDLQREVERLHRTRHATVLGGSEDALEVHTERMLALEAELLRRLPNLGSPDPMRTRAGSRRAAGQPSGPTISDDGE